MSKGKSRWSKWFLALAACTLEIDGCTEGGSQWFQPLFPVQNESKEIAQVQPQETAVAFEKV